MEVLGLAVGVAGGILLSELVLGAVIVPIRQGMKKRKVEAFVRQAAALVQKEQDEQQSK